MRRVTRGAVVALLTSHPEPGAAVDPPPQFVDVAVEVGLTGSHLSGSPDKAYIVEAKGGGAAFVDVDGDGRLDIYLVSGAGSLADPSAGPGNSLYLAEDAGHFRRTADALGARGDGWGMGVVAADLDGDADQDLYVTNLQGNSLFRNDDGHFVDTAVASGVAVSRWSTGAAVADADLDGDLDLYVANYVEFRQDDIAPLGASWRGAPAFIGPNSLPPSADAFFLNDGDGTFTDATTISRLRHPTPGYGLGVLFADVDGDGDPDLFVANDSSPNFLYLNDGGGRFTDASLAAEVAMGPEGQRQACMGVAWGDADGDGHGDLFVTNFEGEANVLYSNRGEGLFRAGGLAAGLAAVSRPFVGFGTSFLDHDNDGDLDLLVVNGHVYPAVDDAGSGSTYAQPDQLFTNDGRGRFELLPGSGSQFGPDRVSRGSAVADYDDDGDLDILVAHLDDRPSLLRNETGNQRAWLGLRLVGPGANTDGIGARVRIVTDGRAQVRQAIRGSSFLSSEDPRLHFGLGNAQRVDSLQITWPSGQTDSLVDLRANRYLTLAPSGSTGPRELMITALTPHLHLLEGGGGNVLVSIGDDGVLLVDSKPTEWAPALRRALRSLGVSVVDVVVNTHFHHDHVGGNPLLSDSARIVAHEAVRHRLQTGPEFGRRHFPGLPEIGWPDITFADAYTVAMNGASVRAVHIPRSHTDGDVIVYFEEDNVVHLGDLFFNGMFPFVDRDYGGDVEHLTRMVGDLHASLDPAARIIPGHGPLACLDDLGRYHEMLQESIATVRAGLAAGKSLPQLKDEGLPRRWASWSWSYVPERRWIEILYWSLAETTQP